jgi:CHAD domain-containing protein
MEVHHVGKCRNDRPALVAFAFQDGLAIQGWHWAGLAGLVWLVNAFFRICPLYQALGISTRTVRQ